MGQNAYPKQAITYGCSVTQRIRHIKQPRGGFINPKSMEVNVLDQTYPLNAQENIHASLVGMAVDYLTRFMTGENIDKAFSISILGATKIGELEQAKILKKQIKGLDDQSILSAIRLTGYDVCYRAGSIGYKPVMGICPNQETIQNVRIMVNRAICFLEQFGPKIIDGFTMDGGYADMICSGDGDFITKDTLWDFKVSNTPPKKEHTLQLLIYWRMGLHSIYSEFQRIKYLGIYNPRTNTIYKTKVSDIPETLIAYTEKEIIGY